MTTLLAATGAAQEVADHVFEHVEDQVWVRIPWPHWRFLGMTLDLSITKHTAMMWLASALLLGVMLLVTRRRSLVPRGLYNFFEMLFAYVREEVVVKTIGEHDADRFLPYLATIFFFVLFMNLLGNIPYASTPTGNLAVTGGLALCTLAMMVVSGMRSQGALAYWLHLAPGGLPKAIWPLMWVLELMGLLAKPFALTVRLFANMIAGHIVIFFLLGLIFILTPILAPASVAFALFIFMLELFVAFLQAYIFTILSSLFIGMSLHAH